MIAIYSMAHKPDMVKDLFKPSGDRSCQMSYFDPVKHERETITVNFEDAKSYAGDINIASYQTHW